ncbi:hypothetical protein FHY09_001954 [Xanthomonas sp. 60]
MSRDASIARLPLPHAAAGLGLRRSLLDALLQAPAGDFDFLECAPENWIHVGGRPGEQLAELSHRHRLTCHGLSLSLGSTAPLDTVLVGQIGRFLDTHHVPLYSEHLSYCSDEGHLYDLLPLPFTEEAVRHTAARIRQVQDILQRRIAVENISYYVSPAPCMDELTFVRAVLAEADCDLLLDVNNVFVNAFNHGYDADAFIAGLPAERIACLHVAGHHDESASLKIDTHGADVNDPVWQLLERTYQRFGARPTLLERDFNIPPYSQLREELQTVQRLLALHTGAAHA